uniref:Uncharacterized protein n=1 Tax=Anguilla anguilla TaxID=7936 RepID=A0A0E9P649_ANGAN
MIEAMQLLGLVRTWMEDPLGKHCFWKWCRWAGLKQCVAVSEAASFSIQFSSRNVEVL